MRVRYTILTVALGISLLGAARSTTASRAAAVRAAPTAITVALRNGLPHGAPTVVIYRPRELPHNVVLVDPRSATATDLAAALRFVPQLRAKVGDAPAHDAIAEPRRSLITNASPAYVARMGRYLDALATAPKVQLKRVGNVRAITIVVAAPKPQ